jgi:hypothetical protein
MLSASLLASRKAIDASMLLWLSTTLWRKVARLGSAA